MRETNLLVNGNYLFVNLFIRLFLFPVRMIFILFFSVKRKSGLQDTDNGKERGKKNEEGDTKDEEAGIEAKEAFTNLINKFVYALRRMSSERIETEGVTRAKVIERYRRNIVLNERNMNQFNETLRLHIRHPRKKSHHRNFDNIFQTLMRDGEKKEEMEKEIKKYQTYLDRREKPHHENLENIVPRLVTKDKVKEEKEKDIKEGFTVGDHSKSRGNVQTVNIKLASLHLREGVDSFNTNVNRTAGLANKANNVTEFVKMTRLTSLDEHLPVMLVFLIIYLLAMLALTYACYLCVCCLRRKSERKKEQPFSAM